MILIGEADDTNRAEACHEMATQPHYDGARLNLVIYSGVYHALMSIGFNRAGTFAAIGSNKMSRPLMTPERGCAAFSQKT